MPTSRELYEKAEEKLVSARAYHDEHENAWSDEDEGKFKGLMGEYRSLKDKADREKSLEDAEKRRADTADDGGGGDDPADQPAPETRRDDGKPETRAQKEERAQNLLLIHGDPERRGSAHRWPASDLEEFRALQADLDASGGFTIEPAQFIRRLIQAVDNMLWMRQRATRIPLTSSDKVEGVSLDTDPEDSTWTSEIGDPDEDTAMAFGGRAMEPAKLTKLLKVSDKLLEVSGLPMVQIIRDRLAYKQAVTQEKVFLTGTGAGQPLGIFTASAKGISTGRDVSTDAATTSTNFDHLKSIRGTLKAQYRSRAAWVAHRDWETQVAKLKDGEGRYIWQQGVQAGDPDRVLGFPVLLSEYAPNTFTTAQYVCILGDLSFYWYCDIEPLAGLDVLREKYYPRIGYVSKSWIDGMPVLEEAFVRGKLA